MTVVDPRPATGHSSPVAGIVTITARSIERTALAVVHEELGVEVSAVRVRLSDDHGGLALTVSSPVALEPADPEGDLLGRLHRHRDRIAARVGELTGRRVSRVDLRITGARTRSTRRVL